MQQPRQCILLLRVLLLLCVVHHQVAAAGQQPPACSAAGGVLAADCVWRGTATAAVVVSGAPQAGRPGPPAILAPLGIPSSSSPGPSSSLALSYMLLVGFQLPDPAHSPQHALLPAGLVAPSATLALTDVRILVDGATLRHHVAYFSGHPETRHYTDGTSWLHVNWHSTGRASWRSVGLLLLVADTLQAARATSGVSSNSSSRAVARQPGNYVLAATNATIAQHLQRLGALPAAGPAHALVYLDSNVTLSMPQPVPAAGIQLMRPLALVGLASRNTSLNMHMQVNQLIMDGPHSNITLDSLVLENPASGDARSAELAPPLSLSSANNLWSLYYNHTQDRLLLRNITLVVGSQADLDYYLYHSTIWSSKLPYFQTQAAFLRQVLKIGVWELGRQTNTSIQVHRSYSIACRVEETTFTLWPVVAPRLPPPELPGVPQMRQSQASALVTAVSDAAAFQAQLAPLTGAEASRQHVILLREDISLQPAMTAASNSSAAVLVPPGVPSGGVPVPGQLSILGELSWRPGGSGTTAGARATSTAQPPDDDNDTADKALHLGFARGLLSIATAPPPGSGPGQRSQLQVQHVWLQGLAQGPRAAAATSLDAPDVWTLLGWAFARSSAEAVVLSACTLELPPPEFEQLEQLAAQGAGQVVLRLAGDVRGSGEALVVLSGVRPHSFNASPPFNSTSGANRRLLVRGGSRSRSLLGAGGRDNHSRALWVDALSAQGMTGSNLVLLLARAAAAVPGGYHWPGGSITAGPAGGRSSSGIGDRLSGAQLAAAIAVPLAVAAAAAALVIVAVRRRRRQHQQRQQDKGSNSSATPLALLQPHSCQSSSSCGGVTTRSAGSAASLAGAGDGIAAAGGDGAASLDVDTRDQGAGSSGAALPQKRVVAAGVQLGGRPAGSGASGGKAQQQQQQPCSPRAESPGLSRRLTAAISSMQHDFTRRRIETGLAGSSGGRASGPAASSPHAAPAADGPQGPADAPASAADCQQQQQLGGGPGADTLRPACLQAAAGGVAGGSAPRPSSSLTQELQVLGLIGRGTFATVHRAIWRGRSVALKVIHLPASAEATPKARGRQGAVGAGATGAGGGAEDVDEDDSEGSIGGALHTRERMAVMEAVVAVTLSHPCIVKVFTFALQPLQLAGTGPATGHSSSAEGSGGYELQLVMELCEEGSLRDALNSRRLVDARSDTGLPAVHLVLALAHDVACAMLHLHHEGVLHSDLKAGNVLLTKANLPPIATACETRPQGSSSNTSSGSNSSSAAAVSGSGTAEQLAPGSCAALLAACQAAAGGRLVARVADFGLSLSLDPSTTHISHMHAGTLTHMAPELLLYGRASKASDSYAFGILLWEMATGKRAFQGMPVALVGHSVTQLGLRPAWVPGVSPALKQLAGECWAQEPAARPSFAAILKRLEELMHQSPQALAAPPPGSCCSPFAAAAAAGPGGSSGSGGTATAITAAAAAASGGRGVFGAAAAATDGPPQCADVTGDWTM